MWRRTVFNIPERPDTVKVTNHKTKKAAMGGEASSFTETTPGIWQARYLSGIVVVVTER